MVGKYNLRVSVGNRLPALPVISGFDTFEGLHSPAYVAYLKIPQFVGGIVVTFVQPGSTADGILVLMHDGDVDRTTDGRGDVSSLTWTQVQALTLKGAPAGATLLRRILRQGQADGEGRPAAGRAVDGDLAAVEQLGRGGGRRLRQIALLAQKDAQAPARSVPRDAAAVHAAADHSAFQEAGVGRRLRGGADEGVREDRPASFGMGPPLDRIAGRGFLKDLEFTGQEVAAGQ